MFPHSTPQRILIVDTSRESREILRLLLERKGVETYEASGLDRASQLVCQNQPDLIVYDAEGDSSPSVQALADFGQNVARSNIPIVVLGTAKRHAGPLPVGQFVFKPYHYAPLIRRIEGLLSECA